MHDHARRSCQSLRYIIAVAQACQLNLHVLQRATTVLLAEIPGQLGLPSGHTNSEELEAAHSFAQSLPAHANVLQRRRVSWKASPPC